MKRSIYLLSSTPIQGTIHLPLLTIEWIDIHIDFSLYDALIFTSKNGVRAMKYQSSEWKCKACYAIAPKTAQLLQDQGVDPIIVGHFNNGDAFARKLISYLTQQRALYVRAQKTVSGLTSILRQGSVAIDEAIVYRTGCHQLKPLPRLNDNAIIMNN